VIYDRQRLAGAPEFKSALHRPHMRRPHMRRPHMRRPHMRRPEEFADTVAEM